ncbi:phytoene desaturase family protein [Jeotgalibacillus campisalis]|uniref:Capsular polysaccharide biosynthesis protein CpsH n=1 Tax=Jeotgalibacillus campisalis TaxID=220754 RepID=A0A0C2RZX5_9BACL|nr:phytoene desaturase family protein [Jeotgalibacillus campisalis]KIL47374.1 capsular polysaccharide biosynthesis protein CpsH [Jeotgalibacillus campisalis]
MKKIAVAGGGIGGMMSALMLARKGFQVTLYEKEELLGGRLAFINHEGYKVDKGPTIVLLPEMLKELMHEAGIDPNEYELIRCDPLYDIHFSDGQIYTKYASIEEQIEEIDRIFPGESENFKRFMNDMDKRFHLGKPRFLEQSFLKRWGSVNPSTVNALRKLNAFRSVKKQLDSYFDNEQMKIAYALQTLYIGGNPYTTPAIYSLVSFSEHKHGIYYVKGGYASLIDVFERALKRSGVEIKTNTPVQKLNQTSNVITSIVVNNEEKKVDAVVMNGDFPLTEKLISTPGKKAGRTYQPSSGCMLIYMGLNGVYEDKKIHQFYMGKDFSKNMQEIFKSRTIPSDPSYYVFHPSIVDETLAPEGKSVLYILIPVPSGEEIDWEKEKTAFADRVIYSMVQNGFEDLREKMQWKIIRTPKEAMQEGLYGGGSFGISPSLFQSGPFRPQFQPYGEIDNLFAVGASIHPGGGIPIVMQGAKLLADGIERKYLTRDVIHNE